MIRLCEPTAFDEICEVINDAASAYRGVIAPDCWKEPYMSREELRDEIEEGVVFWGFYDSARLSGVMGLQHVGDVALIRHAYTRAATQSQGIGGALLAHLRARTDRPMLVGTWRAASWAVQFYQGRGFRLVSPEQKDGLLRRYWTVSARQIEESVVLADGRWFSAAGTAKGVKSM